jgi:triphosphoribosyl-dephospho-CoA synthase
MPELVSIPHATDSGSARCNSGSRADLLALAATYALIEEANLTPKPGLVDRRGAGAHTDLTLKMMHRSARCLFSTFKLIAQIAEGENPTRQLREQLGVAGRNGESRMLVESRGCNTHRGAIWTLGLLVAGAAMGCRIANVDSIARNAARLARYPDRFSGYMPTNGSAVARTFGAKGARDEAKNGFPHIVEIGLPALLAARARGVSEDRARLDALMAIMSRLVDTCLLHRGGWHALDTARQGTRTVLEHGGTGTSAGMEALMRLDALFLDLHASPGGSADMLAGTLFLDFLARPRNEAQVGRHGRPSLPSKTTTWKR